MEHNDQKDETQTLETSENSRFQQLAISDEMFEAHLSDIESQLSNLDIPVTAVFYKICNLTDLLIELMPVPVPEGEGEPFFPVVVAYRRAFDQLWGAWYDLDPSPTFEIDQSHWHDDPWQELCPSILWSWDYARRCMREEADISLHSAFFQNYCARGGVGVMNHQDAYNLKRPLQGHSGVRLSRREKRLRKGF